LRLAQWLSDPGARRELQAANPYYRLPECGAHTALGDVGTVADLFATVLRPIAEQRGLETWEQLAAYAAEEWFPSRIASVTASGQELPDELRGRDGLWLVTRAAEVIEMPVFSDEVIRLRRDGAIGEFVVFRIGDDEPDAKRGTDPQRLPSRASISSIRSRMAWTRAAPDIRPTISVYSSRISVDTAQRNAPSNQASSSGA
jgi:hypothetical protein